MGDQVEAPAASTTTVDMEAAEQLIQLSGGCDGDAGGESESRSADSVMDGEKERGGDEKGVPAVVDSSTSEKPGDDIKDEAVPDVVESSSAQKGGEKPGTEKGRVDDDEAVMGGLTRKKPRFRSLAAIYRETKRIDHVHEEEEEAAEDKGTRRKGKGEKVEKKKTRRATDSATDDEGFPAAAKRVVRRRTSTVRES